MFKKTNRVYVYLLAAVISIIVVVIVIGGVIGGLPVLSETLSIPYFSTTSPDHTFPPSGDIWAITSPPDWTPPSLPGADYTPRPVQFATVPPRNEATPTLLPDVGIELTTPSELNILSMLPRNHGDSHLRAFALADNSLVAALESNEGATIALLDISSNEAQVLTTTTLINGQNAVKSWVEDIKIAGNHIIWTFSQYKERQGVLYLYNSQNQQAIEVTENAYRADISESMIIWQQSDGYQWDVWGYDLARSEIVPIVNRSANQGQAVISGKWVVYQDATIVEDSRVALYAINVDNQEDIYLAMVDSFSDQYTSPSYAIALPWIVWATESKLNFYNLETRNQHSVPVKACPSSNSKPAYLDVSEDVVVFSCGQKMGYDIVRRVFFSLPLQYTSDLLESSWVDWVLSEGSLVWVLSNSPWDKQSSYRVFSAQIERKP